MKEVMAIIRMNKINQTKKALIEAGVSSMTAMEALGRGKGLVNIDLLKGAEQGFEEAIAQLGQTDRLIPKRAIFLVVPEAKLEAMRKIAMVSKTFATWLFSGGNRKTIPGLGLGRVPPAPDVQE